MLCLFTGIKSFSKREMFCPCHAFKLEDRAQETDFLNYQERMDLLFFLKYFLKSHIMFFCQGTYSILQVKTSLSFQMNILF